MPLVRNFNLKIGYAYLLEPFTPQLRSEGFSELELDAIWRDNPFRWLTSGHA